MRYAVCLVLSFLFVAPLLGQPPETEVTDWSTARVEIEQWLNDAEVVEMKEISHGVTNPYKVTLEIDGKTLYAAFKPIERGRHRGFWESYQAEVVAYELDKLVGLGMVPPTVKRTIKGKTGSLQYWVEGCESYGDAQSKLPQTAAWSHQLSRMKIFDNLIYNEDRNAQNFLVDPEWNIVLIDHSRAFLDRKRLLKSDHALPVQYDRKLLENLKGLNKEALDEVLKGILMGGQVKAILVRRDDLVEHVNKLIAEKGEARVFF